MNKNNSENSGLSTRRRTSRPFSDDIEVRDYVDDDGYKVIESHSPHTHIKIRYSSDKNHMEYTYNSHIKYSGPIDRICFDSSMNELEQSVFHLDSDFNFQNFQKEFEDWSRRYDEWSKQFDMMMAEMPTFSTSTPRIGENNSNSHYCSSSSQQTYLSDGSHTTYRQVQRKRNNGSGCGCLGCLGATVISLVIVCLILYGMGTFGGWIIDLITGLF